MYNKNYSAVCLHFKQLLSVFYVDALLSNGHNTAYSGVILIHVGTYMTSIPDQSEMDIIGLIGPPGWGTSIMEAMDSTIDTVDSIELDLLVLFEKSKFYFLKNVICSRSIPRASTYKSF